jgi:lysozyme family protein
MTNIPALINANAERWQNMRLDNTRVPAFQSTAARLCAPVPKARFQEVTTALVKAGYSAVPWWFVAVVAEREYGGPPHWDKQLGQGDPLDQVSHNDPAGRGPFRQGPPPDDPWLRCCLDALIDCAPHAALWNDWTSGGTMTLWEEYNGLGYAARGVPSAYVWSGTDQYVSGKYVADHEYRANVKDVQEGCAPILDEMMILDRSIQFAQAPGKVIVPSPVSPVTPVKPSIQIVPPVHVAQGGLVSELLDAFRRL